MNIALRLGGLTFELHHYLGETDDGTWMWIPERKVAIVGDLLEGDCPNIGITFLPPVGLQFQVALNNSRELCVLSNPYPFRIQ